MRRQIGDVGAGGSVGWVEQGETQRIIEPATWPALGFASLNPTYVGGRRSAVSAISTPKLAGRARRGDWCWWEEHQTEKHVPAKAGMGGSSDSSQAHAARRDAAIGKFGTSL
jgi:hypothetical protein